jgi:rubrerythrin
MENRPTYIITSEKAKDLANEHKIAREIIKQARKAESESRANIRSDIERITEDFEELSREIEALKKSVKAYSKAVPDAVFEEQKKFRIMARTVQSIIERNIAKEINSDDECSACGQSLADRTDRDQFCPVCGQRFKDTWNEL